jgi:DNA primase catalytic core
VDTTRTDHHPNNPSHPTPRALDLRERLDSAADEGLSRRRLDDGAFRRFVDDVKARTDLVALIGRDLDLEPSGSVLKARSPKLRDTDPSFVVWPATQTWHDFSGGGSGGGDCLDYLVQHRGLGFMEALRALAAEAGVPMPGWSPEQAEAEAKRVVERRRIEALLTEAAGYYHRVLPSKIRRELYGRHYGFSDATIDQLQLGWGGGDLFEHLTETCGASREEALATGLFVLAGSEVHELFRWRLVLPYWRSNRVVYFIARRTEYTPDNPWEQAKYKKLLTHGDKHRYVSAEVGNDYFFGEDAAREGGELLICEGITDAISAMQAGVPCISPVTVRFRKQDHDKLVALTSRASRVVICNDAEESGAGEAGTLETARVLHQAGRDVRIASIPRPAGVSKIHVNELVRDQGPQALRAVMAQSKKLPAFLLERIASDTDPAELEQQLAPVLEAVVQCSPLERDAHFDAIAKRFEIRRRTPTSCPQCQLRRTRVSSSPSCTRRY